MIVKNVSLGPSKNQRADVPSHFAGICKAWAEHLQPLYFGHCNLVSEEAYESFFLNFLQPIAHISPPGNHIKIFSISVQLSGPSQFWRGFRESIPQMTRMEQFWMSYRHDDGMYFHRFVKCASLFPDSLEGLGLRLAGDETDVSYILLHLE